MASSIGSRRETRAFRRTPITIEKSPAPNPSQFVAAAPSVWTYWAMVGLGLVLVYVSLLMDDGLFDEFMFGFLALIAAAVAVRETYRKAQTRARESAVTASVRQ